MHVDLHHHAVDDLRALAVSESAAAAAVFAVIEQLEHDPKLIDKLTQHGNNVVGEGEINVKRWQSAKSTKGDLWRFRVLNSPATTYRVVYGYFWPTRQICVLAVVQKDGFDYDDLSSPIAQRILADWRSL